MVYIFKEILHQIPAMQLAFSKFNCFVAVHLLAFAIVLQQAWLYGSKENENYKLVKMQSVIREINIDNIVVYDHPYSHVKKLVTLWLDLKMNGKIYSNRGVQYIGDNPAELSVGKDFPVDVVTYNNDFVRFARSYDLRDQRIGQCFYAVLFYAFFVGVETYILVVCGYFPSLKLYKNAPNSSNGK